jgi:hypothetical protein
MDIVTYIRESCERQNATTPEDFINMTLAYCFVVYGVMPIDSSACDNLTNLEALGFLVDPVNVNGYRTVPVVFDDGSSAPSAHDVPRLMDQLMERGAEQDITHDEWYQEFERIHPFQDGNGRVGSLFWNMLHKRLGDPIHPPEYTGKIMPANVSG